MWSKIIKNKLLPLARDNSTLDQYRALHYTHENAHRSSIKTAGTVTNQHSAVIKNYLNEAMVLKSISAASNAFHIATIRLQKKFLTFTRQ